MRKSIDEAKIDGINTVIDMYDFTPKYISRLPFKQDFKIYFLGYPTCTKEQIKYNVKHYAKATDWMVLVNDKYLNECAERFDLRNKLLQEECEKYNYD